MCTNKRRKANILDNMMVLMGKYAVNLEELVHDRTEQLMEEKKKTEELLHQMLPSYVTFSCYHVIVTVIYITLPYFTRCYPLKLPSLVTACYHHDCVSL